MEPLKIKIERVLLDKIIEYIDIISQILSKSSSSFQSDLFQQVYKNYNYNTIFVFEDIFIKNPYIYLKYANNQ